MRSAEEPRLEAHGQLSRLLAGGGAALVTALTVAGALGLIPGVSAQQTATAAAGNEVAAVVDAEPSSDANASTGVAGPADDWLRVEDAPPAGSADTDTEVDPDTRSDGYSLPAKSGQGKRIVYDISAQHTWLVSGEQVLRHYPVSGGRDESLLEPGRYDVYSKSRHAVAFNLKETMNYMVRFSHGNTAPIGFHDVPEFPSGRLAQTREALGTPQSAGCIRQWITDARALWKFSEVGTPVIVKA